MNANRPIVSRLHRSGLIVLTVIAAFASGCVMPEAVQRSGIDYQPIASPARIDASASLEAVHTLSQSALEAWDVMPGSSGMMQTHVRLSADMVRRDWTEFSPFARVVPAGGVADYAVRIEVEEHHKPEKGVVVKTRVTDVAAAEEVASRERREMWGSGLLDWKWLERMPPLMAEIKAEVVADIERHRVERKRAQEERKLQESVAVLTDANLEALLASADANVELARTRNRALIAAKNRDLPRLLREGRTSELTALGVRIEQCLLDLNHETEVAKDRAQQLSATGATSDLSSAAAAEFGHWRGLAISYRERIELLKPILEALKAEIAQRSR
jgi:hypothetical protein